MKLSAAVLAGGESTRMGRDKALLDLDGRPMVCHVVDRLRAMSDDVFVVSKRPDVLDGLGVRVVTDDVDEQTPLAGIARALRAAASPWVFVCACDMPFVSRPLVGLLAERAVGHDVAVPLRDGRPEPLHAVWSTAVAFVPDERGVHRVLDELHVAWMGEDEWREIDPSGTSFVNINTPEDLARI